MMLQCHARGISNFVIIRPSGLTDCHQKTTFSARGGMMSQYYTLGICYFVIRKPSKEGFLGTGQHDIAISSPWHQQFCRQKANGADRLLQKGDFFCIRRHDIAVWHWESLQSMISVAPGSMILQCHPRGISNFVIRKASGLTDCRQKATFSV